MINEAEVWRTKANSAPSAASARAMKSRASRVISVKPRPLVSMASVAVAMLSAAALRSFVGRVIAGGKRRPKSALLVHLLLHALNHVDEPAPDLLEEAHDPVHVGVARQLQHQLVALFRRTVRRP